MYCIVSDCIVLHHMISHHIPLYYTILYYIRFIRFYHMTLSYVTVKVYHIPLRYLTLYHITWINIQEVFFLCPDFLHFSSWKESRSPCLCILSVGVDSDSCKSDRIILSRHSETFCSKQPYNMLQPCHSRCNSLSCHSIYSIESQACHSPHRAINGP